MEENRKGPGVFYAVVGVATLVVAIIGATFAFFSASTGTVGQNTVKGETQYIDGSSLTLTVTPVEFTNAVADYHTLVPAYFGKTGDTLNVATPAALQDTQVSSMISNKCVNNGFTGCHVYKIDFSANQDVTHANLLLNLSVANNSNANAKNVVAKSQWGYALFTETGTVADGETTGLTLLSGDGKPAAIGEGVTNKDVHNNAALTGGQTVTYYLLVYVNDTDLSQNAVSGDNGDTNYVVGSYSGTLELQALGGKVRASFGV